MGSLDASIAADSIRVVLSQFDSYLGHLRQLISTPTVTSSAEHVHAGIQLCRRHFEELLTPLEWTIRIDTSGNLQCIPPAHSIDESKPALWLCAHIDTVNADSREWYQQADPFTCNECESYLTGRGSNDCKAGVAFMMWYAELLAKSLLPAFNGGFLVTCHEEAGAPVPRTAPQYAADFAAGDLPISTVPRGTFLLCLENTVSLGSEAGINGQYDLPEIGVYTQESHSFVMKAVGSMPQLRNGLKAIRDPHWKTVALWPVDVHGDRIEADSPCVPPKLQLKTFYQEGGHSCTVQNTDNRIHAMIMGTDLDCCSFDDSSAERLSASILAWSGHESESSKISSTIVVGKMPVHEMQLQHALLLNYRGLAPVEIVMANIELMRDHFSSLDSLSDMAEGIGADQTAFLEDSILKAEIGNAVSALSCQTQHKVRLKYETNPGRSDASHVWRSLPDSLQGHRIVPVTCGPGHRSHRDRRMNFMRKTHGVNEGFHKETGLQTLPFFVMLVRAFPGQQSIPSKRARQC